ncbi:unnamed protein product [Symbiodinium natans]|uniref:Uncharacterized protein n=1 Tax=Symbiodinium natans TaxID=878477 RepID=A0A812JJT8_9DINO|nr:unnamed protein product [Symbiodinium natans]
MALLSRGLRPAVAEPITLPRRATLGVQPPDHARSIASGQAAAALAVFGGCALLSRRQARGRLSCRAEVGEAPKRLRRRRKAPRKAPETEFTSDMCLVVII